MLSSSTHATELQLRLHVSQGHVLCWLHYQEFSRTMAISVKLMLWFMCVLQYDPDLLNSFDSNPKRHLNYAARYSRSESLVDEEDAMLSYEAQPWNSDLEGTYCCRLAVVPARQLMATCSSAVVPFKHALMIAPGARRCQGCHDWIQSCLTCIDLQSAILICILLLPQTSRHCHA